MRATDSEVRFGSVTNHPVKIGANSSTTGIVINTSNNVGIGTTGPLANVDISGANVVTNSRGNLFIRTNDSYAINKGGQITFGGIYTGTTNAGWASIAGRKENGGNNDYSAYLSFGTAANGGLLTEKMRITSTGNVGIGTTSPSSTLHVKSTSADGYIIAESSHAASSGILEARSVADRDSYVMFREGTTVKAQIFNDSSNDALVLTDGSNANTIHIKGSNVGIGTSNPSDKLHVDGNIRATGDIIAQRLIVSSSVSVITQSFSSGSTIFGDTGDDTHQFTGSLFVTGSIGFNTTSPDAKLHLNTPADGKAMQFDRAGQETYRLSHGVSGLFFTKPNSVGVAYGVTQDGDFDTFDASQNRIIRSDASSGNVGINNTSPSEKLDVTGNVKATAFLEQSSVRYKENIETLESPLEKITKLRGVSYNLIENKEPNIGMIAEEVNEIFPELVNKDDSGEVQSMSYTRMTAVLLEAVKELTKEVKELKKVNTYYKNKEEK